MRGNGAANLPARTQSLSVTAPARGYTPAHMRGVSGMSADGPASDHLPGELTPEEAREKRARYLALYHSYAEADRKTAADDADATDPTMATFILPGD